MLKQGAAIVTMIIVGGCMLYGATGTTTERLPEQEPETESVRPVHETTEAEGEKNNGESLRDNNSGIIERPTAGEATSGTLQDSVASGEEYIPDITVRAERAAGARKRAEERRIESETIEPVLIDDTRSYGYLGVFSITAYTAGYESTQKKKGEKGYGQTATGTYVEEGRTIAADWGVLPPGSVVQIEGLDGTYTVEDRGGGVNGNHIDLYIADLGAAKQWGRQKRSVWVVEWGVAW